jgi:alpha-glucosidase
MEHIPANIQQFLKDLPTTWDEVKFIDGFPGKYVVVARKYKNKWYIAGINGEQTEKQLTLNLAAFGKKGTLITDGETPLSFSEKNIPTKKKLDISMQAAGGFVIVLE